MLRPVRNLMRYSKHIALVYACSAGNALSMGLGPVPSVESDSASSRPLPPSGGGVHPPRFIFRLCNMSGARSFGARIDSGDQQDHQNSPQQSARHGGSFLF